MLGKTGVGGQAPRPSPSEKAGGEGAHTCELSGGLVRWGAAVRPCSPGDWAPGMQNHGPAGTQRHTEAATGRTANKARPSAVRAASGAAPIPAPRAPPLPLPRGGLLRPRGSPPGPAPPPSRGLTLACPARGGGERARGPGRWPWC